MISWGEVAKRKSGVLCQEVVAAGKAFPTDGDCVTVQEPCTLSRLRHVNHRLHGTARPPVRDTHIRSLLFITQ